MTRSKLEAATTVDIVLSCILPAWGLVVGCIALIKHERKRGTTMITVSFIILAGYFMFGFLHR